MKQSVQLRDAASGTRASVLHDDRAKAVRVSAEDEAVARRIRDYFGRKREFKIPTSSRIDDFNVVKVAPTESGNYFLQALCEFEFATDIEVLFDTYKKEA